MSLSQTFLDSLTEQLSWALNAIERDETTIASLRNQIAILVAQREEMNNHQRNSEQ